jgi:hypothetical protein
VDSIPNKYQNIVNLGQFNPNKPAFSTLDIDSIPNKYQVSGVLLTDTSNLNVDSIPNKYQNIVNLGQFNPFNSGQSLLDVNSIPNNYQVSGQLLTDISNLNVDSIPAKYQNIVNLGQFNPFNSTQSVLDVNSIPNKYQVSGILLTDTSVLNVDSIPNKYQNIVNLGQFNPSVPAASLYDIDSIPNKYSTLVGNGKFTDDNTIIGNRWSGNVPPAVNYFKPDALQGSVGFTTKMDATQFVGIIGNEYLFTNNIQKPLATGVAKLSNQLGLGSVFNYTDGGAPKTKTFTVDGYSALKKYGDRVKSNNSNPNDSLLYKVSTEENSPSAIDLQYAKFNLQDDSYNPFYLNQPYVLRGIQRKGSKSLQRWGGSALADDGLIRGGIAASVERSAFDVARLSQWIASPKGLLWVTKQVGLGLSNPKVETSVPIPLGQTRIQSGITSLLSVPTTAFGVHFTRHGLPFLNEEASYGNVQTNKESEYYLGNKLTNRLISLKQELIKTPITNKTNGLPIASLSYFGGPNSAYGIGFTNIRRSVNTNSDTVEQLYHRNNSYVSILKGLNSSISTFNTNRDVILVDDARNSLKTVATDYNAISTSFIPVTTPIGTYNKPNPFKRKFDIVEDTTADPTIDKGPSLGIKAYQTLAYNKIPKKEKISQEGGFNDFRKEIGSSAYNKPFLGDYKNANYKRNNLENRGWGEQGKVGVNRSDIKTVLGNGDRVNAIDFKQNAKLIGNINKGDYKDISGNSEETKDFIAFYFAGRNHHENTGDDVMIFRANIQGFTDSFSKVTTPL